MMFLISRFNSISRGVIIVMRLRVFLVVIKVRMQFRVVVVVDVKERSIDKPRHNAENAVDCGGDAHGQYSTPNYRNPCMLSLKGEGRVMENSSKKLALAAAVALVTAVIVLFVAILPAEYGIDPLGTGKALGLTDLADAAAAPVVPTAVAEATIMPMVEPFADKDGANVKGTLLAQPRRYNVDSREIVLDPHEGMEIKYNMKKGAGLVYSWVASKSVRFEFHGEPDITPEGGGSDYYESYDLDYTDGKTESHGTFIAPSTGVHGWFWENVTDEPVTVRLIASGFYDWVFHNRKEQQTALKPMDAYSFPSHPTVPDELMK